VSTPSTVKRAVRRIDGLRFIALLKFGKAFLLLITAIGAHQLLKPEVAERLYRWSTTLADNAERIYVIKALNWLSGPGLTAMSRVELATEAYLALVLLEGIGLWMHKRWAEWLVVLAGAALIPVEIWKLFSAPRNAWLVIGALAMNVFIVGYLAYQLRRRGHDH
jgi:uncharacterized membrane protein (DUF2068 family)